MYLIYAGALKAGGNFHHFT